MSKNAFVDPVTGVLTCWGFVETNSPGEIKVPVSEDFALEPGNYRWDGATFIPHTPPVIIDARKKAIEALKVLDPKKATAENILVLLKEAL